MVNAIISLLTNTFISGLAFIGGCTVILKLGKFFKVIEQEETDGFKKGFDAIMVDSIDEINKCFDSVGILANNSSKIFFTVYDIVSGTKVIKKNKDGKIIITSFEKVSGTYKSKIDELNNKVKIYEDELSKMKKTIKKEGYVNIGKEDDEEEDDDTEDAEEDDDAEEEDEDAEEENDKEDIEIEDVEEKNEKEEVGSDEFFLEK